MYIYIYIYIYMYIYIYIYIYIYKIRHLLSGVIFRFLPNLESSKVWKKPKYNSW